MTPLTVHTLHITLLDDAVFSRSNATAGAHDTLSHIPGSALLGAAASRLYAALGAERAFLAFHSGKLRFGDGWPLAADGALALPAPQSLHRPKEGEWLRRTPEDSRLITDRLRNFVHTSDFDDAAASAGTPPHHRPDPKQGTDHRCDEDKPQPKQLRDGYLTLDGRWVEPATRHRLKTAIDPLQGRASEGQLFGYSALQAGQRFVAELHADADLPRDVLDAVLDALRGRVLLGRSRSAEYGAAQIDIRPGPALQRRTEPAGDVLTLWLLTDLAPADSTGGLPGVVTAEALGLPEGFEIAWNRSFARARSYSPWNAYRHGYAQARWVLQAGSVLALRLPTGFGPEQRAALCAQLHAQGLGLERDSGCGQVWADPPLLAQAKPQFAPPPAHPFANQPAASAAPALSGYSQALWNWLGGATQADASVPYDKIHKFLDAYRNAVESGRRAAGIPATAHGYAPSRSQWGAVYEKLRQSSVSFDALFDPNNGVIKPSAKGWNLEIPEATSRKPLAQWLRARWEKDPWNRDVAKLRQLVRHLKDLELHAAAPHAETQHG